MFLPYSTLSFHFLCFLVGENTKWMKVFADRQNLDPDVKVTVLPEKLLISTLHFCKWAALLSGRSVYLTVLMFINTLTLGRSSPMVYLKVLVVLPAKQKVYNVNTN